MPDERFPTEDEYWSRLDKRGLEDDLKAELRQRAASTGAGVARLGDPASVVAFIERLLPGSAVPAGVLASFLDAAFDRPLGRGDESPLVMPIARLIPAGFAQLDAAASGSFAALTEHEQDDIIRRAEQGEISGPEGFDSKEWFKRVRDLLMLGYGSDPRAMVQMGFPGPAYKSGHVWLSEDEIAARADRRIGYQTL